MCPSKIPLENMANVVSQYQQNHLTKKKSWAKNGSDFSHTFFLFGPSFFFVKKKVLRASHLGNGGTYLGFGTSGEKKHMAMWEDVVVAEKLWRILILFRKCLTDTLFFFLLPVIFWILPEIFVHSHSTDLLKVKKTNP